MFEAPFFSAASLRAPGRWNLTYRPEIQISPPGSTARQHRSAAPFGGTARAGNAEFSTGIFSDEDADDGPELPRAKRAGLAGGDNEKPARLEPGGIPPAAAWMRGHPGSREAADIIRERGPMPALIFNFDTLKP